MPRKTDTYDRVLELAIRWTTEGRALEPTAIRKELGTGSFTTITRALQDFKASQTSKQDTKGQSDSGPSVSSRLASKEDFLGLHQQIESLALAFSRRPLSPGPTEHEAPSGEQLVELDKQLKSIIARFDGTQRHMLLQVEEARTEAAKWKERCEAAQREARTWREAAQDVSAKLREEVMWLRGQLGLPQALSTSSEVRPARVTSEVAPKKELKYPGHPRAIIQPGDEEVFE